MRRFLTSSLLLALTACSSFSLAQTTTGAEVSGKLTSENDGSVQNATISLLRSKDSVTVKTALPEADGLFIFEQVKPGNYLVSVSLIGHRKYFSDVFTVEGNSRLKLPEILLQPVASEMTGVTVESKKPFIERKLDRFIVNVENSIVAAGSTVLNVLERSPGIIVNEDNGIQMRGRQGIIVMLDGKPSPLSGTDLINYLKSLPASAIEKIEIITNPSARYDAAGNAGIINIRFKKDQRQGLNGVLTLSDGQGVYNKPMAATSLNYRKKKWNLFGNYSFAKPTNFTRFYINRRFFDDNGNTLSVFDQTSYIKQPFTSNNLRFGADYYINPKTVIGVLVSGNFSKIARNGNTHSVISKPDGSLDYTTETDNNLDGRNRNMFANLNFKHTLDSTGRELTMDVDMGAFRSTNWQQFNNQYLDANGDPSSLDVLHTDQTGKITVQSFRADYVHPLAAQAKLEAGVKASYVKTNADIKFFIVENGSSTIDATRSNQFIYSENVNAAYINLAKEYAKVDVQLGLRMEHTVTNGRQITTGERFSRNYVLLFPSVFVNRKFSEKHQLSFSYSRRIDRPSYRQLNPFRIFVDPYTYVVGDPALRPVLTNSFESNYIFLSKYIATLSYTQSKATITDVFAQDDATKISYQIPANIQDFEQFNLGLTIPVTVGKWMNSSVNASGYYNKYKSPLQGGQLVNNFSAWSVNVNNSFVLGKNGWAAELSGFYQSKSAWGLFLIKNMAQVSTGIQKTTRNRKSTFKLAVSDIFRTNRVAVEVDYQNMDFHTNRTWDSRVATLSFTHRFGNNKVAQARRRTTGVEDEKRRAN